jgi:transcription elongation GreA/GreB family factor
MDSGGPRPTEARKGASRADALVSPLVSTPEIIFPEEVAALLERKKFAELEDDWVRRLESGTPDLPLFFAIAAAAKKKGHGAGSLNWLRLLADELGRRGDPSSRMRVLLEIARMAPADTAVRPELEAALKERFAGHPSLSAVLAKNPIVSSSDPGASASKIERWLRFRPGDIYYLPGRGPGRIVEMNPALDVLRLEVNGTKLPLSLVTAEKMLQSLPEGHFLREKLLRPDDVRMLAASDPSETVRRILASFGRPVTLSELKEHLAGIVDDSRWTSFWTAAKKHPQLLVSGSAKSGSIRWSESADAADDSIRRDFLQAEPRKQIEIARKHGKRSKAIGAEFAARLSDRAKEIAERDPALAWEMSSAAARLSPSEPEAFPAEQLLAGGDIASVITRMHDSSAREKALEAVRAASPRWADLFADQFHREEDSRVLAYLHKELGEVPERRDEIDRRILRSPRSAPRAFVWLAERLQEQNGPAGPALFLALVDALRQDEFSPLRARLKEFFDPGHLAVRLARAASEEEAREFLTALTRASGLEEHRRSVVREALLMAYPDLRAPAREYLYGTADSIEARRQELLHLRQVDLPANAEAMRTAKEHGDLRENFEYQSARQKHEYLSARIATLADELSRTRALDPAKVDTSEVRVGTRVRLRELEGGAERVAVILGPWDSKPEENVYSYQSEYAQGLLGRRQGERVSLSGVPAEIVSIAPWR